MSEHWKPTTLTTEAETFALLTELYCKVWLCRGQSKSCGRLVPSIDREPRTALSRLEKLRRERQSIDLFRESARYFSHPGEQAALHDDLIALLVLRHYGVPSRLLDWSRSPQVAAYFAVCGHDAEDGEIWCFDESLFQKEAKEQWKKWPETTSDGSGNGDKFEATRTMFTPKEPPDWLICGPYRPGFPRQKSQDCVYTLAARFARDHAEAIAQILKDNSGYARYVIPAKLKPALRRLLRENYAIWRGSLFPDSAGAAGTAETAFDGLPTDV